MTTAPPVTPPPAAPAAAAATPAVATPAAAPTPAPSAPAVAAPPAVATPPATPPAADPKSAQATAAATRLLEEAGKEEQPGPAGQAGDYQFTAPEGQAYDPEVIAVFGGVAKELGLTQQAAQQLLDKVAPVMAQRHEARIADMGEQWAKQTREHPTFGGANLPANLRLAQSAFKAYAPPELLEELKGPLQNHPGLLQFAAAVGKAIASDRHFAGKAPSTPAAPSEEEVAARMYPSSLKR